MAVVGGTAGRDTIAGAGGEGGRDRVEYGGSNAGVSVNPATGRGAGGHAEGDTPSGVEQVVGSANTDTLIRDGGGE